MHRPECLIDRADLLRALGGDSVAMRALIDAAAPVIHVRVVRALMKRHASARGRNVRQEMEDMVQEVFAALLADDGRTLRAWDPERGLSFLGFVGFIAEREVAMIMRTGKRSPWTEDPTMDDKLIDLGGASDNVEERVATRELLTRIADRLREQLSPQGRQCFQMLYVEDRSVQSVSSETGMSIDALYAWRSRVGRLLRKLRDELAAEET